MLACMSIRHSINMRRNCVPVWKSVYNPSNNNFQQNLAKRPAGSLRKVNNCLRRSIVHMNIRCAFCQTPYTLSRVAMLDALQEMDAHKLTHYDAHCPRCRRATQIPRQRMEMFMPNWREELKQFEV